LSQKSAKLLIFCAEVVRQPSANDYGGNTTTIIVGFIGKANSYNMLRLPIGEAIG
jgi:hypothetical protein